MTEFAVNIKPRTLIYNPCIYEPYKGIKTPFYGITFPRELLPADVSDLLRKNAKRPDLTRATTKFRPRVEFAGAVTWKYAKDRLDEAMARNIRPDEWLKGQALTVDCRLTEIPEVVRKDCCGATHTLFLTSITIGANDVSENHQH